MVNGWHLKDMILFMNAESLFRGDHQRISAVKAIIHQIIKAAIIENPIPLLEAGV